MRAAAALALACLLQACGGASGVVTSETETAAARRIGMATLSWVAPTTQADGTPLLDLAGFRVWHGTAPGVHTQAIEVPGPDTTSKAIASLPPGRHYFVVTALDARGNESEPSVEVSKALP